jgi:hypothetical protein
VRSDSDGGGGGGLETTRALLTGELRFVRLLSLEGMEIAPLDVPAPLPLGGAPSGAGERPGAVAAEAPSPEAMVKRLSFFRRSNSGHGVAPVELDSPAMLPCVELRASGRTYMYQAIDGAGARDAWVGEARQAIEQLRTDLAARASPARGSPPESR